MTANRICAAFLILALLSFIERSASAGGLDYTIDILSSDKYPELKDAWMYRINNHGVAAGYIATQSSSGPYLPATYSGGRFQTYGLQSALYGQSVSGLNDRGDIVGTLFDKNFNQTAYIVQGGVASYLDIPAENYPYLYDINNAGVAYGADYDLETGLSKVFTVTGGVITHLSLAAPGFSMFDSTARALTDSGLLGVIGYSDDFTSTQGFVKNLATGSLIALAMPGGFANFTLLKLAESGLTFGQLYSADYSITRLGSWAADGTFLGFVDVPDGMNLSGIRFNNLGQAVGLLNNNLMFYDGSSWSEREVAGLNGYTLLSISDLNDRGDFVGLARNPEGTFDWGFVAHAVPEPGSLTLMVMGLGVVPVLSRRLRARLNLSVRS